MFATRVKSFGFAFKGLRTLIVSQQNAWIHAVATVTVAWVGFQLELSVAEWRWIVLAVTLVWAAEAFNTALEFLTDLASPDQHPLAAKTKDVAAGGVLVTAMGAALIGCLVFGPYVLKGFAGRLD